MRRGIGALITPTAQISTRSFGRSLGFSPVDGKCSAITRPQICTASTNPSAGLRAFSPRASARAGFLPDGLVDLGVDGLVGEDLHLTLGQGGVDQHAHPAAAQVQAARHELFERRLARPLAPQRGGGERAADRGDGDHDERGEEHDRLHHRVGAEHGGRRAVLGRAVGGDPASRRSSAASVGPKPSGIRISGSTSAAAQAQASGVSRYSEARRASTQTISPFALASASATALAMRAWSSWESCISPSSRGAAAPEGAAAAAETAAAAAAAAPVVVAAPAPPERGDRSSGQRPRRRRRGRNRPESTKTAMMMITITAPGSARRCGRLHLLGRLRAPAPRRAGAARRAR